MFKLKINIKISLERQACDWYKVAFVAAVLTLVMYHSARCPHHTTAGILCICRDGKLIYLVLRNMNLLKRYILGNMSPVQKALKHSTWCATCTLSIHVKHSMPMNKAVIQFNALCQCQS